jgi:hypothetical protein
MRVLYERRAGVDVGKDEIIVAVRVPGGGSDWPVTVRRTFRTFYGVLCKADLWLMSQGVTRVASCQALPRYGSTRTQAPGLGLTLTVRASPELNA